MKTVQTIQINLKTKPKKLEVEMSSEQFENFKNELMSGSTFVSIGDELFINKAEIVCVEAEDKNDATNK